MNYAFHRLVQRFPHFVGKNFLVRRLYKEEIDNGTELRVEGKFGCTYYLPNIVETVGFEIFSNGIYEPETIDILSGLLPENGKFIDIGGNIGSISIPLCKNRPDIKALAIEAAPWVFDYLQRNLLLNGLKNIKIFNSAMFDKDNLELDFFSPHDKFGKGSLASVFTSDAVKVKTLTLDSLVRENDFIDVDVIKVDVEGFEQSVFAGASNLLSKAGAPAIFFEFVDWAEQSAGFKAGDAQRALKVYGYKLFKLDSGKFIEYSDILTVGYYNIMARK